MPTVTRRRWPCDSPRLPASSRLSTAPAASCTWSAAGPSASSQTGGWGSIGGERTSGAPTAIGGRRAIGGSGRAGCANARARSIWWLPRAALEAIDGTVITGCNIENATYGLTICAERVAMFKAISEGHREFTRVAIVADTEAPTPPCGACRQILWEFGGNVEVVLANMQEEKGRHRLIDLLPLPFDARLL